MSNKNPLIRELTGLGKDLANAVKKMSSSQEFKVLERDVSRAATAISKSLSASFKAAGKSPQTKRLKNRLGRVLREGRKQGSAELTKAQKAATKAIQQARRKIKTAQKKKR